MGKGSKPRPMNLKKFRENWDEIFKRKENKLFKKRKKEKYNEQYME